MMILPRTSAESFWGKVPHRESRFLTATLRLQQPPLQTEWFLFPAKIFGRKIGRKKSECRMPFFVGVLNGFMPCGLFSQCSWLPLPVQILLNVLLQCFFCNVSVCSGNCSAYTGFWFVCFFNGQKVFQKKQALFKIKRLNRQLLTKLYNLRIMTFKRC